jgi:hypothetical protein
VPTRHAKSEPTDQPSAAVRASCAGVPPLVQALDLVAYHQPALERDEVRHNVILANLGGLTLELPPKVRRWSLGAHGACAVQMPGYPIAWAS